MKAPLKQIFVSIAFVGLVVLLYFAPRGYPGVKNKNGAQQQQQQQNSIETQIAQVKKDLGPDKVKGVELYEKQLAAATTNPLKIVALDSLISQWDKLLRPFIAAHYSFEKSELIDTFAAWFETGNRFYALTSIIPPDKKDERAAVFQQAGEAYKKALTFNPGDKVTRTRAAICQVESNPPGAGMPQGIMDLRALVAEDSTNVEAQLNLGLFGLKSGQYDKAEKRFRTVIALDPKFKDGYWYLAGALEAQSKNGDAITYYKEYIAHNADNPDENKEVELYIDKLKSKKN